MLNFYRYIAYALIVLTLTACGSAQPAEAATKAQSIQFLLSQVRASGVALSGGKVDFYEAGATTTRKTVWIDRNKATPAANPYTLDSNGTAQLYGDGLYRIVIKDSAGVTKYDRDYISIKEVSGNVYDVADYASLAAAVASIGSTKATLQFATDQTLTGNLTIPANITLVAVNGAKIIKNGYDFTGLLEATPELFGDDVTAINSAIDAVVDGGKVYLRPAIYSGSTPVYLKNGVQLLGSSKGAASDGGTQIVSTSSSSALCGKALATNGRTWNVVVSDITFTANSAAAVIDMSGWVHSTVQRVKIQSTNATGDAIKIAYAGTAGADAFYNRIEQPYIVSSGYGIHLYANATSGQNSNTIVGGKITSALADVFIDQNGTTQNTNNVIVRGVALECAVDATAVGIKVQRGVYNEFDSNRYEGPTIGITFDANSYSNRVEGGTFNSNSGGYIVDSNANVGYPNGVFAPVGNDHRMLAQAYAFEAKGSSAYFSLPNGKYYQSLKADGTTIAYLIRMNPSDQIEFGQILAGGTFAGLVSAANGLKIATYATASLPAGSAGMDGQIVIENAGAGSKNLVIYGGGQRFRISGGAAF